MNKLFLFSYVDDPDDLVTLERAVRLRDINYIYTEDFNGTMFTVIDTDDDSFYLKESIKKVVERYNLLLGTENEKASSEIH